MISAVAALSLLAVTSIHAAPLDAMTGENGSPCIGACPLVESSGNPVKLLYSVLGDFGGIQTVTCTYNSMECSYTVQHGHLVTHSDVKVFDFGCPPRDDRSTERCNENAIVKRNNGSRRPAPKHDNPPARTTPRKGDNGRTPQHYDKPDHDGKGGRNEEKPCDENKDKGDHSASNTGRNPQHQPQERPQRQPQEMPHNGPAGLPQPPARNSPGPNLQPFGNNNVTQPLRQTNSGPPTASKRRDTVGDAQGHLPQMMKRLELSVEPISTEPGNDRRSIVSGQPTAPKRRDTVVGVQGNVPQMMKRLGVSVEPISNEASNNRRSLNSVPITTSKRQNAGRSASQ